ncbi:MAG: galactose-1-phosphate uridylyltransferase [Bdellovibrionota bacterium]
MFKHILPKPDGRRLLLYGMKDFDANLNAPSPSKDPVSVQGAHMRWHPLRGEWVSYSGHRQNRTFLPPKEFNPLAPMRSADFPTELPQGDYDVAVFENMFPTLSAQASAAPFLEGVETMPSTGACEVVVFTKDSETSLGRLSVEHIALLLEVWGDRYKELGARKDIHYVLPFENRGVEVGVTLHHPHGQIYAYPFIPPIPARMVDQEKRYYEKNGKPLMCDFVEREIRTKERLIYKGTSAVAFVPVCARYPYEVWIAPRKSIASLGDLSVLDRLDFAKALKTVLMKFDALWNRPFPYLMTVFQAPTDGQAHPEAHFHFEFYPPYRSSDKLKYLAGTEIGAGMFANDAFPEAKAKELQAIEVHIENEPRRNQDQGQGLEAQ